MMADEQGILQSEAVRNFVAAAEAYCAFIENQQALTLKQFVWEAADVLSALYNVALALPDIDPDDDLDGRALLRRTNEIRKSVVYPKSETALKEIREKLGSYDVYREVFDPYDPTDEPIPFEVSMDLIEIYDDMKEGLVLFSDGGNHAIQALWDWRFGLLYHWGPNHLTNVLRPITWIMQDIDHQETKLQAQDDDE